MRSNSALLYSLNRDLRGLRRTEERSLPFLGKHPEDLIHLLLKPHGAHLALVQRAREKFGDNSL